MEEQVFEVKKKVNDGSKTMKRYIKSDNSKAPRVIIFKKAEKHRCYPIFNEPIFFSQ